MERKLKGTVFSMPQLLHTQVALILLVVLTIYKKQTKVIVKKKDFYSGQILIIQIFQINLAAL